MHIVIGKPIGLGGTVGWWMWLQIRITNVPYITKIIWNYKKHVRNNYSNYTCKAKQNTAAKLTHFRKYR